MFKNPGGKLKVLAKVLLGIVTVFLAIALLFSLMYLFTSYELSGSIISIIGFNPRNLSFTTILLIFVSSYISCLTMYGIGEAIENTEQLVKLYSSSAEASEIASNK